MCASRVAHVMDLFSKLQWLGVCFWMQFKVLFFIFKALREIEPPHLRNFVFSYLRTSTHPIRSSRKSMLQVLSAKEGSRRHTFSPVHSTLYISHFPEVRLAPSVLAFQKSLKISSIISGDHLESLQSRWMRLNDGCPHTILGFCYVFIFLCFHFCCFYVSCFFML